MNSPTTSDAIRARLPAATAVILGAQLPVPPVELHIEGRVSTSAFGDEEPTSLNDLIILAQFGLPAETA